jgi:hypothetical protein
MDYDDYESDESILSEEEYSDDETPAPAVDSSLYLKRPEYLIKPRRPRVPDVHNRNNFPPGDTDACRGAKRAVVLLLAARTRQNIRWRN